MMRQISPVCLEDLQLKKKWLQQITSHKNVSTHYLDVGYGDQQQLHP